MFHESLDVFTAFCEACLQMPEEWTALLDDMDLSMLEFRGKGFSLVLSIGRQADIFGLKSGAAGRWGSPWHEMTGKDLCRLSVDEPEHLLSANKDMAVDELSYLCSGRTDWGLCRPSISAGPASATKKPKKWGDPKQCQAIFAS